MSRRVGRIFPWIFDAEDDAQYHQHDFPGQEPDGWSVEIREYDENGMMSYPEGDWLEDFDTLEEAKAYITGLGYELMVEDPA